MKKITLFLFCFITLNSLFAQKSKDDGKTVVIQCSEFNVTRPLREIIAENPIDESKVFKKEESSDRDNRKPTKFVKNMSDYSIYGNDSTIMQFYQGLLSGKAPLQSWAGQTASGFRPFDPSGAVGPNHYIQMINSTTFKIYSKTGTALLTATFGSLWTPATGNEGDPIVLYDKAADRWFMSQFGTTADKKIYIAISTTNDPTGSYYTYSYVSPQFPDYLKFSVWSDGYYMTSNQSTQKVFCFERAAMLAGSSSARSLYTTFAPPKSGFFVPLPGDASDGVLPPVGTPCPIFSYSDNGWGASYTDAINIYKMAVTWGTTPTGTITLAGNIPTAAFDGSYDSNWDDISQPGTTQKLDGIGGVCTYRAQWKTWGDYNTVVLNWGVKISASQRSIMWCELRQDQTTGNWSIYQQGIYTPDTDNRWLGSIAMNDAGDIALCYAKTNATSTYMSLYYTGRKSCDPLGTLPISETLVIAGSGSQTGGNNRVGDYSQTCLDPDGVTFWHTGEYMGTNGNAKTQIFSFQLPGACQAPSVTTFTPATLYKDKGKQITFTGAALSGCTFTIDGVSGTPVSNNGTTAIINFPAANYTNGILSVTNSSGSVSSSVSILSRNTIPVDATAAIDSDIHKTIGSAATGVYNWLGSNTFTNPIVIDVYAGTYAESVTLNTNLNPTITNTLTIQAHNETSPVINATGLSTGFKIDAVDNVTFTGFTIYGATTDNLFAEGLNLNINNIKSYNAGNAGIKVNNALNANINHNLVYDNKYGIYLLASNNTVVKNNTSYGNGKPNPGGTLALVTENFTSATLPANWTQTSDGGYSPNVIWRHSTLQCKSPARTTAAPIVGGYWIVDSDCNGASGMSNGNAYLTTSVYDLTGKTSVHIKFDHLYRHLTNAAAKVQIKVGAGAWTDIATYSATEGNTTTGVGLSKDINVSAYADNQSSVQFRFWYYGSWYWYWILDNFQVTYVGTGSNSGSALFVESGTGVEIKNNILVSKAGDDNYLALSTSPAISISNTSGYNTYFANGNSSFASNNGVSYSDLTTWNNTVFGNDDLNSDPLFVSAGTDFHLQSVYGSYHGGTWLATAMLGGTWTIDISTSPAIDAGDPADDYSNETVNNGNRINQGVYGNTVQASNSSGCAPQFAATPSGTNNLCINPSNTNYTTAGAANATSYTWFITPIEAGTISGTGLTGTVTWNPTFTGTATIKVRGENVCGNGSNSSGYSVTVNPIVTPLVSISTPSTSVCVGTNVIFTATPTNGGTSPSYQWKLNGNNDGTNSNTYSNNLLNNNDFISCDIISNASCITTVNASSNTITMSVNQPSAPVVSISALPVGTICSGTSVTFTAIPTNGGTSPSYQWKLNGNNGGSNSPTYTNSALTNGNTISCVMTSNSNCVTTNSATSNTVTMSVTTSVTPSVSIAASPSGQICTGENVTFTATPTNGGISPSYQWKLNGNNVGTNNAQFSANNLATGNIVSCVLTSSETCVVANPVNSNSVTMSVISSPTSGFNYIENGLQVTFTNTSSNASNYVWNFGDVTGTSTVTNPVYTYSTAGNYNVVLTAKNPACEDIYEEIITVATVSIVELNDNSQLMVYPNPSNGIFDIKFSTDTNIDLKFKIYSIEGKLIYSEDMKDISNGVIKTIDISKYASGVYQLDVYFNDEVIKQNIIVK